MRQPDSEPRTETPAHPDVLSVLVENHRAFLDFVARRVGDRDVAEEIVQSALVKSLDKAGTIEGGAVTWFYAVLRNAIIDYRRRKAASEKRLELYTAESALRADDAELKRVVCQCVGQLAVTLKPEYADALQRIEIEGESVKDYAERVGISANNAGVRVFRAREALHKQVVRCCGTCATHGCFDCTCSTAPNPRSC